MKIHIYILGTLMVFLSACQKDQVERPDFRVRVSSEAKAGEALNFSFDGQADVITFYSGEPGHAYRHKERTQKDLEGTVNLSFSTRVMNSYELPREVDVLVSTDFNGVYEYPDVVDATWSDISNRFEFSVKNTGVLTESGIVDISDQLVPGEPLYIAFRYRSVGTPPGPRLSRQWRVELFSLINEYASGSTILAEHATAGWSIVSKGNVDEGRGGSIQSTRLNFFANNVNLDVPVEEWGITQAIDLYQVEPDNGVAIKNTAQNRLDSFSHVYSEPGTYEAVFVASNANIYGNETVVKKVRVVVDP